MDVNDARFSNLTDALTEADIAALTGDALVDELVLIPKNCLSLDQFNASNLQVLITNEIEYVVLNASEVAS